MRKGPTPKQNRLYAAVGIAVIAALVLWPLLASLS
jgi:hypothetical protein